MSSDDPILDQAWHARDLLYKQMFGSHLYTLPKEYAPPRTKIHDVKSAADIAAILGTTISETDIPVMVHEPGPDRDYWLYTTAGLSNPWFGGAGELSGFEEGGSEVSGFGLELVLKSKKPGRWQVRLLRRLISYVVTYSGTLQPGVLLQFDMPLFYSGSSKMDSIIIWYTEEGLECVYDLPSGRFGMFLVLGLMDDEAELVRSFSDGAWCMQQLLQQSGHHQITDPWRASILQQEDIRQKLFSLRSYAQLFATVENVPPGASD